MLIIYLPNRNRCGGAGSTPSQVATYYNIYLIFISNSVLSLPQVAYDMASQDGERTDTKTLALAGEE